MHFRPQTWDFTAKSVIKLCRQVPSMFVNFFHELKTAGLPVSLREYLTLLEAMDADVIDRQVEDFYFLSRSALVKDEKNLDKFDQVFGHVFKGLESLGDGEVAEIPEDWLKALTEKFLTEEEKAQIESLGGWDKIMETLKKRLEEQEKRHEGGNKMIGTAGTSPFGAEGYNPEGVRIGQKEGRHGKAVKVWDKREYKNLDDSVELGTRNIKVALRRLRRWAREGAAEELDLDGTIKATADHGYLDIQLIPERRNTIKTLLFFDVGGSMDPHIKVCEELFSAARTEFKNMEYFYFHNCLYEDVWKDNRRRHNEKLSTWDVLHRFPSDYKVIFVGDASMSPYEITYAGGSVEHWNEEPGGVWLERLQQVYENVVWLNPVAERHWEYTPSIELVRQLIGDRMFPLTLEGLDGAMRELSR
ncbi:VWA domain-containing protein [Pyruvatibacter mobilis]|nr:VWA domain-containing protein [Pyruvatibacter mobilis]